MLLNNLVKLGGVATRGTVKISKWTMNAAVAEVEGACNEYGKQADKTAPVLQSFKDDYTANTSLVSSLFASQSDAETVDVEVEIVK